MVNIIIVLIKSNELLLAVMATIMKRDKKKQPLYLKITSAAKASFCLAPLWVQNKG
ncbi:hypothetical protein V462_10985 [Pantoea ananatis 15320]|nr:hypothetical protein V462_10985 [Pantoea ananatis 15320]